MDEVERLRGEVAAIKAAMRRLRVDLARKAAALAVAQTDRERIGIRVVRKGEGEGDPWPETQHRCST
jgi:hypothetical protein